VVHLRSLLPGRDEIEAADAVDEEELARRLAGVAQAVIPPGSEPHLLSRPQHRGRLALHLARQFARQAVADLLDRGVLVRRGVGAGGVLIEPGQVPMATNVSETGTAANRVGR